MVQRLSDGGGSFSQDLQILSKAKLRSRLSQDIIHMVSTSGGSAIHSNTVARFIGFWNDQHALIHCIAELVAMATVNPIAINSKPAMCLIAATVNKK